MAKSKKTQATPMTVGELKAKLAEFPDDLPVFVAAFLDLRPFDGEGTDMSGHVPLPLKSGYIAHRDSRTEYAGHRGSRQIPEHIYIESPSYDLWDYYE